MEWRLPGSGQGWGFTNQRAERLRLARCMCSRDPHNTGPVIDGAALSSISHVQRFDHNTIKKNKIKLTAQNLAVAQALDGLCHSHPWT